MTDEMIGELAKVGIVVTVVGTRVCEFTVPKVIRLKLFDHDTDGLDTAAIVALLFEVTYRLGHREGKIAGSPQEADWSGWS
jgi:hypothetical protein